MPLLFYKGWLTPDLCQLNPSVVFTFGDNARRIGTGGQAVIRKEPNVLGIATKRIGDMARGSFFEEGNAEDRAVLEGDLAKLRDLLVKGVTVVIPLNRETGKPSFGLERAQLVQRAPSLYALICDTIEALASEFGSEEFVPRK